MSITPTPAQITLGTYARLFVRHWKAVVAGVLIGLIAATAMFLTAPKAYTSRTSVLVRPTVSDGAQLAGGRTSSVLNLDTEAQILGRRWSRRARPRSWAPTKIHSTWSVRSR